MKRTHRSRRAGRGPSADPAQGLRESAQKIWLAGLGALERARTDGPRAFESLVEQGRDMGARAVGLADEALRKVLTDKDVEALTRQVHDLSESMRRFVSGVAGAGSSASASAAKGARRAPSAPAKAARRRRAAKAASATHPSGGRTSRKAAGTRKTPARKPRKAARKPKA